MQCIIFIQFRYCFLSSTNEIVPLFLKELSLFFIMSASVSLLSYFTLSSSYFLLSPIAPNDRSR